MGLLHQFLVQLRVILGKELGLLQLEEHYLFWHWCFLHLIHWLNFVYITLGLILRLYLIPLDFLGCNARYKSNFMFSFMIVSPNDIGKANALIIWGCNVGLLIVPAISWVLSMNKWDTFPQ